MIYMDYNATAPVHPEVLEAFLPFYRESFGNPSSIHQAGSRTRKAIEEAREKVASFLGCKPVEVVFTSSGTEADNMAVKGVAAARRSAGNHIVTTRVEHPAVLNACLYLENNGFEITRLDVDESGIPDLGQLEDSITGRTILISAMYANNETGTLLPAGEIGEIAARHGVPFHCDAVQAAGKIPVNCRELNTALLAISGHKLGAPQGIGALVVRTGTKIQPLIHGGAQERNRRAGTENVAGIVALGKACELAHGNLPEEARRIGALRDRLEQGIIAAVAGVRINGDRERRLPNTANISFAGVAADSLLASLDLAGIALSSGAACSSGSLRTSHVLSAMGVEPELAKGSIRFSLGRENDEAQVDSVLRALPAIVARLRRS
ncbi:MAG TPA: aminotransferase class V-fold PLP-dependent enzyme [Geobacteraceae bacterium]